MKSDCLAPPCLDMAEFLTYCRDTPDEVYRLAYFWYERVAEGFYSWSHVVARNVEGYAVACSRFNWDSRGVNLAHADTFLSKVASWMTPPPEVIRE